MNEVSQFLQPRHGKTLTGKLGNIYIPHLNVKQRQTPSLNCPFTSSETPAVKISSTFSFEQNLFSCCKKIKKEADLFLF